MPRFLVTYHGAEMPTDPESAASAQAAFSQWAATKGGALADPGAPIQAAKTVSSSGVADGQATGPMTGWSVVEADNADAAAGLVADHPFLSRGVLQVSSPPDPTEMARHS
jgi:hypothetical protein